MEKVSRSNISTETPKGSRKRKRQLALGDGVQVEKKNNRNNSNNNNKERIVAESKKKKKSSRKPLHGIILSVSTLDVKDKKHSSNDSSFSAVSALCTELGAKVTPQVHKKVFAVICNQSAVTQLTQRVRKAIKKKHSLIIDVEWIKQCQIQQCRVDHEQYLLTDLALEVMEKRSDNNKSEEQAANVGISNDNEMIVLEKCSDNDQMSLHLTEGWSAPVTLDCCCVCHETNRDDCKWCVDCNVTLARKNRTK